MNVSIGDRWEKFVATRVAEGRFGSASDVVREGLRLLEERETRLASLRQRLDTALAEGGEHDDGDLDAALAERELSLRREGL